MFLIWYYIRIETRNEIKIMQVTLNGFTFQRNADGTDNIQAVLKNKDNKALAGIVKEAKIVCKLLSTKPDVAEFVLHVQEVTDNIYQVQKAPKGYDKNKKRFKPTVHTLGI